MTNKLILYILLLALFSCNTGPNPTRNKINTKSHHQQELTEKATHKKIYDTVHVIREEVDLDEDNYNEDYYPTSQYKIWKKRVEKILSWNNQYAYLKLPMNANIIDIATINTPKGPRTILAWMTDIKTNMSPDNEYTCPEVTQGKGYFNGRLHYTLVDNLNHKLINSIYVCQPDNFVHGDTLTYYEFNEFRDYPFAIANPKYQSHVAKFIYHARGGTDTTEGEAEVLYLWDFNNDGKAYEFSLFDQTSCVGKGSTLFGYSERGDSLKWFAWEITNKAKGINQKDSTYTTKEYWLDEAMAFQMDKDGKLNFLIDYRGRDGDLCRYYFKYSATDDTYSGIIDTRLRAEDSSRRISWLPQVEFLE